MQWSCIYYRIEYKSIQLGNTCKNSIPNLHGLSDYSIIINTVVFNIFNVVG